MTIRLFISGACGYIGSRLCEYLLNSTDYEIYGVDNLFYNQDAVQKQLQKHKNFKFYKYDVTHDVIKKVITKCDVIIPLAGLVGVNICNNYPEQAKLVNYNAIRTLVDSLGSQRVILPNTTSCYGQAGKTLITESDEQKPLSFYARTKVDAEKYVLEQENTVSLRLGTVFGWSPRPRIDLLVNDFTYRLLKLNKLAVYEAKYIRSIVHIMDVVRCINFFINNRLEGIYNVSWHSMGKLELAEDISKQLELKDAKISPSVGQDADRRNYRIDSSKLINAGFTYKYHLGDGIKEIKEKVDVVFDKIGGGTNNR